MEKNIDLKRRKPRQLRGTPANKFSLYVSGGVCAVGILFGLVLYKSKFGNFVNSVVDSKKYELDADDIERRIQMAPPGFDTEHLREHLKKLKNREI